MRLRHVARLAPPAHGFGPDAVGDEVSFLPLERIWADDRFDPSETIEYSGAVASYNAVNEGDLLLPKVSPTFTHGRCAVATGLIGGRGLATSEVFVIRAHDPADARFLQYRLRSPDFLDAGQGAWLGVAGLKRVPAEFVRNVRIDRSVWRRRHVVAEFLDLEIARISDAVAQLGGISDRLKIVEQHIADRCVVAPSQVPLKAVATIRSGVTLNDAKAPADAQLVPYLRVANVKPGWLDLAEVKEVPVSPNDIETLRLQEGDLLLTEGGDLDRLGCGTVWKCELPLCLFQNHIFAVRPLRGRADATFLAWASRSSVARAYFSATASRITIASTNRAKLGRWPVPDLPADEQVRRAKAAEHAWSDVTSALTAARSLGARLDEYRDSLIHEAVTGKLDVMRAREQEMEERLHAAAEGRLDEVVA